MSALGAFLLVGCDDNDKDKPWLVDRTRVLGLRTEAKADPGRASISPGEAMHVTWLVGAPSGTGHLNWAYALCPPALGTFPEPKCTGAVFSSARGASDGELVGFDVDAPTHIDDLEELQLLTAFCDGGEVTLDATRFEATCANGAPPQLASASVRLTRQGPNRNPEMTADAILLDGAPLAPSPARAGASCVADGTSPFVIPGGKYTIAIRLSGGEREAIAGGFERVLVSHVVTAGELERQYSMLAPTDPAPKDFAIEWMAPAREQVGDGGALTEIYVVVRDGRGGAAFARRTVCVRK